VEFCQLLVDGQYASPGMGAYSFSDRSPGFAIYNYSTGSGLIAYGLSGKQALASGIFSPLVLAALCVLCSVSLTQMFARHLQLTRPARNSGRVLLTMCATMWLLDARSA
jgi:hypothetical protein